MDEQRCLSGSGSLTKHWFAEVGAPSEHAINPAEVAAVSETHLTNQRLKFVVGDEFVRGNGDEIFSLFPSSCLVWFSQVRKISQAVESRVRLWRVNGLVCHGAETFALPLPNRWAREVFTIYRLNADALHAEFLESLKAILLAGLPKAAARV